MGQAPSERLIELSAELSRLAYDIDGVTPYPDDRAKAIVTATVVREVIRARRMRGRFFDPELFGEPAWDIMLDLLAARLEGRNVPVSSLCVAASVPNTTALRWITSLTGRGLLERKCDPVDRRRVYVALTDEAASRVTDCLARTQARVNVVI